MRQVPAEEPFELLIGLVGDVADDIECDVELVWVKGVAEEFVFDGEEPLVWEPAELAEAQLCIHREERAELLRRRVGVSEHRGVKQDDAAAIDVLDGDLDRCRAGLDLGHAVGELGELDAEAVEMLHDDLRVASTLAMCVARAYCAAVPAGAAATTNAESTTTFWTSFERRARFSRLLACSWARGATLRVPRPAM